MLQLSTDIGSMADRIGEMADNILVMSDNIGLMADRILLTQELQNRNVELTINSILQTQTNSLALVSVVEDSSYDVDFARLISEGELLAVRMSAVAFSPWTLDDQLAAVRDDVKVFLADVQSVQDALSNDSTMSTLDISYDALIQLGNMSLMLTSLASAVDAYVIIIEGLQAFTPSATLADAMHSMLMMSGDTGCCSAPSGVCYWYENVCSNCPEQKPGRLGMAQAMRCELITWSEVQRLCRQLARPFATKSETMDTLEVVNLTMRAPYFYPSTPGSLAVESCAT